MDFRRVHTHTSGPATRCTHNPAAQPLIGHSTPPGLATWITTGLLPPNLTILPTMLKTTNDPTTSIQHQNTNHHTYTRCSTTRASDLCSTFFPSTLLYQPSFPTSPHPNLKTAHETVQHTLRPSRTHSPAAKPLTGDSTPPGPAHTTALSHT